MLTMDARPSSNREALRDEKSRLLKSISRSTPKQVVRGQFKGYREEDGVAKAPPSRPSPRCGSTSTAGAGPACRS